jgi:hypothetical protein
MSVSMSVRRNERSGNRAALGCGKGILKTARECGTGVSVAQRIKAVVARAPMSRGHSDPRF